MTTEVLTRILTSWLKHEVLNNAKMMSVNSGTDKSQPSRSKDTISSEKVQTALQEHVASIDTINSWDDVDTFLLDHQKFMVEMLRATERLNPSTVTKAARMQYEADAHLCKRFGEMVAQSFSYIKEKSKRTAASMKHQPAVVKDLVSVIRATASPSLNKSMSSESLQKEKASPVLPLRAPASSTPQQSSSKIQYGNYLLGPVDRDTILAKYGVPEPPSISAAPPTIMEVASSDEGSPLRVPSIRTLSESPRQEDPCMLLCARPTVSYLESLAPELSSVGGHGLI